MYQVAVKSGTNGYYDMNNCDRIIAEIPSENIPRIGEILEFGDADNHYMKQYVVREVKRTFNHKNEDHEFGEWVKVYVINA